MLTHYFTVVVLVLTVVTVTESKAQYDPYHYGSLYEYQNFPLVIKNSPLSHYNPKQNRLFLNYLLDFWVSTSTSTTTCTVSTSYACGGRRINFISGDVEENGAIQPSTIQKVEATQVVELVRGTEREAKYHRILPQGTLYEIEPTFGQNILAYSSPEQLYKRPLIHAADPRWGFYFSTKVETVTYSSTPSCYTSSGYSKCK